MLHRTDYHEVAAENIPDDARRINPLIGNDEIKLCVDGRGVMHDCTHVWGSHPPARITWSGRRNDRRNDRYNSNLFEWGFLDLSLNAEDALPAVTGWRQRLHPRDGYVETEIARGDIVERTISFVHLEKNLIVFHREYKNLPANIDRTLRAKYTLCHVGTEDLPFRVRWTPNKAFVNGISADTLADGVREYRGRIALFADAAGEACAVGNRLELAAELPDSNALTVCLALADDLGDHPQLIEIPTSGWMTPPVKKIHEENLEHLNNWQPANCTAAVDAMIADIADNRFAAVFAAHRQAWNDWFAQARIELPEDETELRAAFDTQLYTMRCCYTAWSSPANPFNTSWGAPYFWDERFPTEGLMRLGITDMPERTMEWRRRILPFSTMMSGGRGARYIPSAVESGAQIADRNCTQYYEFFTIGVICNYIYEYCRIKEDEAAWRRFYPILRESAEFFRRYLLIELPGNNVMLTWLVDVNETFYPVQDGPFATCGAARIFYTALETAERLGIEEKEIPEWKRMGAMVWNLATHLCGGNPERDTSVTTADDPASVYVDYELDNQQTMELDIDEEIRRWRDEYRKRFVPESQMGEGKTNLAGEAKHMEFWSWGPLQKAHSAASREDAEDALHQFKHSLTTLMDFAALNESAQTDLSDVHHPWFNTAAGAYVRALTRMLVYPKDNEIILLPGIPAGWDAFSFELPVHRGGTINVEVENGRFISVVIAETQTQYETRRVHLPHRYLAENQAFGGNADVVEKTDTKTVLQTRAEKGEYQLRLI
ncbi:MAG: hypothetical protein ACOCWJ_02675 [Verrucomicrobiota bacterium]